MNFDVMLNGNNINNHVISYVRNHILCEGVGKVKVELTGINPSIGDVITIYENGTKKGRYFIKEVTNNADSGTKTIDGQDSSWKLENYFITDNITVNEFDTNLYYIQWVLGQADINYSIDVDVSEAKYLEKDTSIGMQTAMDLLLEMCRYSGWYFWFDANDICHISKIRATTNYSTTITDYDIIDIEIRKDDKMLRNRGLVYGGGRQGGYIIGESTKMTGYEYDDRDIRTVVYSNPNLHHLSDAGIIAKELVEEFARPTKIKVVTLEGLWDLYINDSILLNSEYYYGPCLITTIEVSVSNSGATTVLTLDQRCPKLIIVFDWDYVYVGTVEHGIWRKPIKGYHIWESFNSGISPNDYEITDLKIKNGLFATIANKKLYIRSDYLNYWKLITYNDNTFYDGKSGSYKKASNIYPCGVSVHNNKVYCIFSDLLNNISWVAEISPTGAILNIEQVFVEQNKNARGFDIDFTFDKQYISGVTPSSSGDGGFSGFADACNAVGGQFLSPVIYNERVFLVQGGISYVSGGQYYLNIYIGEIDLKSSVKLNEKSHSILATGYVGVLDPRSESVLKSTRFHYLYGSKAYFSMAGNSIIIFYVNLSNIDDVGIVKIINRPRFYRFVFGNYYLEEETVGGNIIYHVTDYITNSRWISNLNPVPHHSLYQYTEGIIYTFGQAYDQRIIWLNPVKGFMHQVSVGNTSDYYAYPWFKLISATTNGTIAKVIYQRQTSINTYKYYMVEIPGGDIQELSFTPTSYSSEVVMEIPPTANINIFSPNIVDGAIDQSIARILTVSNNNEYLYFITNPFPNIIKYRNLLTNDEGVLKFESTIGSTDYDDIAHANCPLQYFDSIYERRFESGVYIIRGDFEVLKTYGDSSFPNDCIFIFNLGSPFLQGSPKYFVARKEPDYYHYVGFTSFCVNLECTDDTVITYPLPATMYQMSGITISGLYSGGVNQGIISDLKYSFTGEYGTLLPVISGEILTQLSGYPLDTRGFYQWNTSGETLHIGTPISLIDSGNIALSVLNLDFETSFSNVSPSGQPTRIETYSDMSYPYLFVSVSGDRVRFFQRDGSETASGIFIDRTNNLPEDFITVIRADKFV